MGDTHPLNTSEHFVLLDEGFNEEGKERQGWFSPYNVNGRIVVLIISITCFLLALALFIGTVVVFKGHHVSAEKNLCLMLPPSTTQETTTMMSSTTMEETTTGRNWKKTTTPPEDWSVTKVNGVRVKPGVLVFSEEFDTFNTTLWRHLPSDSGSEFFHYVNTRNNSFVRDGVLYLKPTFTADAYGHDYVANGTLLLGTTPSAKCQNSTMAPICWKNGAGVVHPIAAPMLVTKNSLVFTYGKLVIRAKMPAGDWIEPLISLQPNDSIYGDGLLRGQVQVIDIRGNRQLFNGDKVNIGTEQNCPDIRYGTKEDKKIAYDCLSTAPQEGFDTKFHDYSVTWTPESLTVAIDDEDIVRVPQPRRSLFRLWSKGKRVDNPWEGAENKVMAPFDKNFYLALGISVGGTNGFFSDDYTGPYKKPWNNQDAQAAKQFWDNRQDWEQSWRGDSSSLQIDSIKLYALNLTVTQD